MDPKATFDLVLQGLVGLIAIALTRYVLPWLRTLGQTADGKLTQQQRDAFYPILINALAWGQAMVLKDEGAIDLAGDALKQKIIDLGKTFMRAQAPGLIDELGVTDDGLQRMLEARLQQAMAFARLQLPGISDKHAALNGVPTATTTPVVPAPAPSA